jgi:CD2 antigen cytoplasmic tail-binding protein 2
MGQINHIFYYLEIGQERTTIGFDDDVKITPFNIDEEMEEGHYDETGCFQWKKKDVCNTFF